MSATASGATVATSRAARMADYIRRAFLARDKATVDQILKDAADEDEDNGDTPLQHQEPDGDEGGDHHNVHVHLHGVNGEDGKPVADGAARLAKLEDAVAKITTAVDGLTKAFKDGELPEALKAHQFGKKDEDTEDAAAAEETAPEMGAQEAGDLPAAEPDLMEADPALKTGESKMGDAYLPKLRKAQRDVLQDVIARAAVLSPGLKVPVLDAGREGWAKRVCLHRRRSLAAALSTEIGRVAVGSSVTNDRLRGMSCDAVRTLFNDSSARMRDINNAQGRVHDPAAFRPGMQDVRSYRSQQQQRIAGINERNREFWKGQGGLIH